MNDQEFYIAACIHPLFKLKWITSDSKKKKIKKKMKELFKPKDSSRKVSPESEKEPLPHAKFFSFFDANNNKEKEGFIGSYLESDLTSDLRSVTQIPELREIFLKYNTVIPSSAPVERLFSIASLILSPRRMNLSDELFEQLLFLKCNFKHRVLDC